MASCHNYQKLRKLSIDEEDEEQEVEGEKVTRHIVKPRRPWRRRWVRVTRRMRWRRTGIRIGGLGSVVRRAVRKVVKRMKEGRSCFGDLFAGNYMFMQITASSPSNTALTHYSDSRFKYNLPRIDVS